MKQKIEQAWKHIALHWSEDVINKQHYAWKTKLRILSRAINNNLILVSCHNCHSRVPGSWVRRADNVCSLCDSHVEPFVDNPVNRKYAEQYLEKYFSCFVVSFQPRFPGEAALDEGLHAYIGDVYMELKKWFKCYRQDQYIIVSAFFRSRAEQNAVYYRAQRVIQGVRNPHTVGHCIELDHDAMPPMPVHLFHTFCVAQTC
jgi:hypothetical protein